MNQTKIINFAKNNFAISVMIMLILPLILISVLSLIVIIGAEIGSRLRIGWLAINIKEIVGIGDYISFYIAILGIEITGILSFAILNATQNSNIINEKNSKNLLYLEKQRERRELQTIKSVVYNDLLIAIEHIRKCYINQVLKKYKYDVNFNIYLRETWANDIAKLETQLTELEFKLLNELYRELFSMMAVSNTGKEEDGLKRIMKHISSPIFLEYQYIVSDYLENPESILNQKYLKLIKILSNKDLNDSKLIVYFDSGEKFYEVYYQGEVTKAKIFAIDGTVLGEGTIIKDSFISGIFSIFNGNQFKRYYGELQDGLFHGQGTEYFKEGDIKNRGIWREDKLIEGEMFGISLSDQNDIIYPIDQHNIMDKIVKFKSEDKFSKQDTGLQFKIANAIVNNGEIKVIENSIINVLESVF